MPDRSQGAMTAILDEPALEPQFAALIDPLGRQVTNSPVLALSPDRYQVTFVTQTTPRLDGDWRVDWDSGDRQIIGVGPGDDLTRYEIFSAALGEAGGIYFGRVDAASGQTLVDQRLLGGAHDFGGYYLLLAPPSLAAGRAFLVDEFNGSTLALVDPVDDLIQPGDRYILTEVNPREAQALLREAYAMIGPIARVRVMAEALLTNETPSWSAAQPELTVTIPAGWSHVTNVWLHTNDGTHDRVQLLSDRSWRIIQGGLLGIPNNVYLQDVRLEGLRPGHEPRWADSRSDISGPAVAAYVSARLLANRSRGQLTDPDEATRRQQLTGQRMMGLLNWGTGRVPNGARRVE